MNKIIILVRIVSVLPTFESPSILDAPKTKKRVSDASSLSRTSSNQSGYLGGSSGISSNEGAPRSRLSLNPEYPVDKHYSLGKIPTAKVDLEQVSIHSPFSSKGEPSKLKTVKSNQNDLEVHESENLSTIVEGMEPLGSKSRKTSVKSSSVSVMKRLTKKKVRKISEEEEEESSSVELSEPVPKPKTSIDPSSDVSVISVGAMVYGRWTDSAGVYFFPAEVLELLNPTHARVRFLEDELERVLKIESELINVKALYPHDEITVKECNSEHLVTAKLMTFPTLNHAGEVRYAIEITPTDSEPQNNEDSRMVHFSEVSLSDTQASLIIRRMGFVPASNKVSADINFSNLIYGKRKPRSVNSSPASVSSVTARHGSPSVTPKKTPRRRRGGSNVEESATTTETSGSEATPRGKKTLTYLTQEEERDNESLAKRSRKSGLTLQSNLFKVRFHIGSR